LTNKERSFIIEIDNQNHLLALLSRKEVEKSWIPALNILLNTCSGKETGKSAIRFAITGKGRK